MPMTNTLVDVVEEYGEQFGNKPRYLDITMQDKVKLTDPNNPPAAKYKEARLTLKENMLAALLISGANNWRYKSLKMELHNHCAQGQDNYLWTLAKALDILNWCQ